MSIRLSSELQFKAPPHSKYPPLLLISGTIQFK
jgi:hypothetical protein